ncbi:MAG TPA: D-aminoacylase [Gemmatimonadaceae bacterium]|nr:D-aminoacylase [Gemmatimonadaceae bacterium]
MSLRHIVRTLPALALSALPACTSLPPRPAEATYDVVLTGGRIVDGTGNPWYYGDVGVVGDRIVRIAPRNALATAPARQRIDATGLVVAPGFIDLQAQSYDAHLVGDGRVVSKIAQGVTTEILGEGGTPAPVNDAMIAAMSPADSATTRLMRGFTGAHGFGAWLDAMERHGSSVNVGSFLGAEVPRIFAKGYAQGPATPAELDTMRRVVRDAMRDGAFGIGSALIYPPGSYAATDELVAMAQAMAPYHGLYISHIRSEDDSLFEAMDEALAIGRRAGVPVEIYHLKAAGSRNWHKAAAMVAKIDSARAAGQDVGATMYPYPASANSLSACIPPWASANARLLENLRDPATRARIVREMADTSRGALPLCQIDSANVIMVVGFTRPELAKYEGWRLDRIAADRARPWAETLVDLVVAEEGRVGKITFSMSDENVAMQLRRPWVVIASDAEAHDPATARGLAHPRAYGTFARVLGRYVRDERLFSLEEAVRRMTSAVAIRIGVTDRGLVRPGMFADLAVFDPATIADRATYERPHQLAVGVQHVLVNGTEVWRDGAATGATPGRALRGSGFTR